ncbi:MAG: LysR family transcriptional regulator [Treponema sp.]|nr:LysR family transcriptional regulator [Treponema sp.]
MTLQQIKYILGVAEAGSFNRASEKLFISQPSLTSSVHDAERELGFEVFNRTSRGVNATERGKDFICDAREVYSHYEDLIKKYSQSVTIHHKKFTKNRHYPLFKEIQM